MGAFADDNTNPDPIEMAYQLIFTSYPESLTTGRTGFSTVARSADMPEKLAAVVERRSVYEIQRGAVFSHAVIEACSAKWHLLTRTVDAGVDYTNRNNFLAHHLVLSEAEAAAVAATPADILARWGGWLDRWEGKPRLIGSPEGLEQIPISGNPPSRKWGEIFGDCGKAALLSSAPAKIEASVSSARELLALFSESSRLFTPPRSAWDATFTTHFDPSENPRDYLWRAGRFPENSGCLVNLDLRQCPPAPQTSAADYARTGKLSNRELYNLKVGTPKSGGRNFAVIDTKASRGGAGYWKIALASAAASVAALAGFFYVFIDGGSDSEDFSSSAAAQTPIAGVSVPAPAVSAKPVAKLSQVREAVLEKIGGGEFAEALEIWNASGYAQTDPAFGRRLLADIGNRADFLMKQADDILSLSEISAADYSAAVENIAAARRALKIDGVPNKEARLGFLEKLNNKISK